MNYIGGSCASAIAAMSIVTSPVDAKSRQSVGSYDGAWHLVFATRTGACDQAYEFDVNVRDGIISHPNLLKFHGQVTANGRVRASVSVSDKFASGTGRLSSPNFGAGVWSGYSGSARCGGTWTAQRG